MCAVTHLYVCRDSFNRRYLYLQVLALLDVALAPNATARPCVSALLAAPIIQQVTVFWI